MGYIFKWDPVKAEANVRIHLGTFEQTSTVFGNLLNLVTADPDHSRDEERYLLLGMSNRRRLLVVAFPSDHPGPVSFPLDGPFGKNRGYMKKNSRRERVPGIPHEVASHEQGASGKRGVKLQRPLPPEHIPLHNNEGSSLF